jgi:outer membrane protein assembly factor BamA
MGRTTFPLLLVSLVVPFVLPAAGQKFQPKTIQFKGDPEYSLEELMNAAGLKKGAVLTSAEMNDHSRLLMDSGVFDNLTYKFDGQDLVYSLRPSAQLYPVRLENLPIAPGPDLDAKLHSRLPLYHGKVPAEGTLLDAVRQELEGMLAAQGITTTVTAVPYSDRKTPKRAVTAISFSIAQPPVKVGPIHLDGVSPNLESRLEPILKEAREQTFDSSNSSTNLEDAFRWFYEDQGYAAVKVHAVRAGDPVVSATSIQVPFAITVEEGRQYKLGAIQVPPDAPVEKAEIDKILNIAGANQSRGVGLRSVWMLVAQRYRSKGYLDCVLTPHAQIDEAAGTVSYTLDVNAGPVYHLAFVKFDSVSDDLRVLLMKNWQLMPGEAFDPNYAASFILKAQTEDPVLRKSLAGVKGKFDVTADPATHEVNLVVQLEG